jgi:inner membrane protein
MNNNSTNPSFFERLSNWTKNSITLKLIVITIIILVLMIPTAMMESLIYERQNTRDEAIREVSSKWGGIQQVKGLVISVPYKQYSENEKGERSYVVKYAHFLPDKINVSGKLTPEKRYRGIYVVVLYNSMLEVNGLFNHLLMNKLGVDVSDFMLSEAFVSVGISDMKGIKEKIDIKINDTTLAMRPGIPVHDLFGSGVSVPVDLKQTNFPLKWSFTLNLNGSSEIYFAPLAKETDVKLNSTWSNPAFDGAFLPDSKTISENGFNAHWRVLELNRNYPQQGLGSFINPNNNEGFFDEGLFGVRLLLPVDEYQKTMRSAKYNIMFIIITFLSIFFIEIIGKRKIHPIQYLLVGFSITLFYVVLLSVSEHLNFNKAYLIGCVIMLSMIGLYAKSMLKQNRFALIITGILALLYIFFYSLLQLQDYALLMGTLGLLIILSSIMYLTRNIDWYNTSIEVDKISDKNTS